MRARQHSLMLTALLGLGIGCAQADFVGLNITPNQWRPAMSASFGSGEDDSIDLVDDLDVGNASKPSMVLILEHPIAVLPNLRYQGYDFDTSGISTLDSDISFNGETFSSGNEVRSTFELSHEDIVLYYQLVNSRLDLDLGVDLKRFDGQVSLSGTNSTSVDIDETIPLLYLSARYELPNSRFYVGAKLNADFIDLGLSDSSAEDSTIMLGYDSGNGLGVEGGYKYFSLELDAVNTLDTDLKYDGLYLNGYYNF